MSEDDGLAGIFRRAADETDAELAEYELQMLLKTTGRF